MTATAAVIVQRRDRGVSKESCSSSTVTKSLCIAQRKHCNLKLSLRAGLDIRGKASEKSELALGGLRLYCRRNEMKRVRP